MNASKYVSLLLLLCACATTQPLVAADVTTTPHKQAVGDCVLHHNTERTMTVICSSGEFATFDTGDDLATCAVTRQAEKRVVSCTNGIQVTLHGTTRHIPSEPRPSATNTCNALSMGVLTIDDTGHVTDSCSTPPPPLPQMVPKAIIPNCHVSEDERGELQVTCLGSDS